MTELERLEQTGPWHPAEGEAPPADAVPQQIGRYRVEKILGEGGFGRVYLAHDDQLQRPVAITIPHPLRVARPDDVEAYLAEARVLASLDHSHIVPVFDVGCTVDGLPFIVSKFIEGIDLAKKLIETLAAPFKPEQFHDEYKQNVEKLIETKRKGRKVTPIRQPKAAPVIDLMQALQQSLAKNVKKSGKPSGGKNIRKRAASVA